MQLCVCSVVLRTGGGGIAPSEAVTIGGKSLGSISDIVRTATGSEFPEIPKHSLMIFERHQYGSGLRYKSTILTISADGSVRKRFGDFVNYDSSYKPVDPATNVVQRMDLAVSSKRFGNRRNIVYATSGLDTNPDGLYGYQTLNSVGTEDSANITSPLPPGVNWWWENNRQLWGTANLTVKGFENKDVFVYAHSSKMAVNGTLHFSFFTLDRNESGNITRTELAVDGGDSQGWKLFNYNYGIRAISMAAGDIDGDGYDNEIALIHNADPYIDIYVYKVVKSGNKLKVTEAYKECIHSGVTKWGNYEAWMQASVGAVTGDFNGDGKDEAAFICKNHGSVVTDTKIRVVAFDTNSKTWSSQGQTFATGWAAPFRATRADFDGDGKDEIAMLLFQANNAELFPTLERWYCDNGSIVPKRDEAHRKGGRMSKELLGYSLEDDAYGKSYKITEDFSITAGPLTGTKGKAKLADDVAISHINDSQSSVYVIPTVLDDSKNFSGFGSAKTVFNYIDSSNGRRGAIITEDFANETLMLGKPYHTMNPLDSSYVTVLQAMPYHVDNVDIHGNLLPYVKNYTFSGFTGDDGNGKMSVAYSRSSKSTLGKDVKFKAAATTDTISMLGDAGPYVQGYLSLRAMGANIAGNFDSRAQAAAGLMNTILDFVTDKIDQTTEKATQQMASNYQTLENEATLWDNVIAYRAQQHIWRYKILNDPLPSWYKLGAKADYSTSKDLKPEKQVHSLTFTLYDEPMRYDTSTERDNIYQPRHEEGNLFSYPADINEVEGYNPNGELSGKTWVTWSKGKDSSVTIGFEEQKIASQGYSQTSTPSELSKVSSAVGAFVNKAVDTVKGWFGISSAEEFSAADISGLFGGSQLDDSTTHSETFTKSLSDSEEIKISLYGRSTLPGEEAGYMIMSMPYIAREGTLKVAHAVNLLVDDMSRLWGANSRYRNYPDPSLVLPNKFFRNGSNIQATDNNSSAMRLRGMRFYVPANDLYSNNHLAAGLTYQIKVPIYNASFVDADNVDVKLSYAKATAPGTYSKDPNCFNKNNPRSTMGLLKEIQTVRVSLDGWPDNKDWATFTWKIPDNMSTDSYIFFVQINPAKDIPEVHDERLDDSGNIIDVGGNNEGFFDFIVTSVADVNKMYNVKAAIMAGELKPEHSDGVLYGAFYQNELGPIGGGNINAASNTLDRTGSISADVKLLGFESDEAPIDTVDFLMVLGLLSEMANVSEDAVAQMEFTVTYDGDEYYPEVYLQGVNFKEGVRDQVAERGYPLQDEVSSAFAVHKMALIPHTTVNFMLELTPRAIDFRNGAGFEFYVPELAAASVYEEIANSQEQEDPSVDPEPGVDPDPSTDPETPTSNLGSPGGGCDAFGLGLAALAGIALLTLKKSH